MSWRKRLPLSISSDEGNDFVPLQSSKGRLLSLSYLNLAHCKRLESLPELQLCATFVSGGRYYKVVSGSHNWSGLYVFNCPLLYIPEGHQFIGSSKVRTKNHRNDWMSMTIGSVFPFVWHLWKQVLILHIIPFPRMCHVLFIFLLKFINHLLIEDVSLDCPSCPFQ